MDRTILVVRVDRFNTEFNSATEAAAFMQGDVTRAVRGAKAAGEMVLQVINEHDGPIVVHRSNVANGDDRVDSLDCLIPVRPFMAEAQALPMRNLYALLDFTDKTRNPAALNRGWHAERANAASRIF